MVRVPDRMGLNAKCVVEIVVEGAVVVEGDVLDRLGTLREWVIGEYMVLKR